MSLVDGYNLPVQVTNNVGCGVPSCPVDLGPNCEQPHSNVVSFLTTLLRSGPAPLQGPYDSTGFPVGCKSACEANLDGDPCTSSFLS